MSWDASLNAETGELLGDWNYTHNCNGMIELALGEAAKATAVPWWSQIHEADPGLGAHSWWDLLDGLTGEEGRGLLTSIIVGLEDNREACENMNPSNGWGSYESLLRVLREMRDAVPRTDCRWSASG